MFYGVLILMLLMSFSASAQNVVVSPAALQIEHTLIHSITMEGFLLQDKNQFVKLFKPYQNKYLSKADMDAILQKIQGIYEQEGFQQLVAITYAVNKHHLIFTVSLTS